MTLTPKLTRYSVTTEVSPRGAFYGEMIEAPRGEYVRFADVEAYTQAAIAAAMMGAVKPLVWKEFPSDDQFADKIWLSETYTIERRTHEDSAFDLHCTLWEGHVIPKRFASLEAAKAAAEADWQARNAAIRVIPPDAMAALEAVKVQVREAIAAWHDSEALRIFDRLGDVAGVYFHRNAAASIRAMKGGAA